MGWKQQLASSGVVDILYGIALLVALGLATFGVWYAFGAIFF
jgi:hypothetical protein